MGTLKRLGLILLLTLAASQASVSALEKFGGGILYGPNWGCAVTAPDDWIMDQTTWASNNIFALFYQKDATFGPAIPIVYVNTKS